MNAIGRSFSSNSATSWFARNLAKLVAVLLVGFVFGTAVTQPGTLPDLGKLLANSLFALVLVGGVLMLPMGLAYLAILAILTRKWSPVPQRMAAVVLSPLMITLYLLWSPRLFLADVLILLGTTVVYGLIVTLPRDRDKVREHDETARGEESG